MFFNKKSALLPSSIIVLCLTFLGACSDDTLSQSDNISWPALTLSPELSDIYQGSCHNCHSVKGTGAPQTGDKENWNAVLEKGLEASLERAISGYGGMPPNGQCFQCNPDQIKNLIRYMSNPGL
mgnify:CR=1 FL=1